MASNAKVAKAYAAMGEIGISEQKVKPVLEKLLKLIMMETFEPGLLFTAYHSVCRLQVKYVLHGRRITNDNRACS